MRRAYDRDYDSDYVDLHEVPVEPMGFWGLSHRSRDWARQESRWGTSERSRPRGPRSGRWRGHALGWDEPDRGSGYGWTQPERSARRAYERDYADRDRERDWLSRRTDRRQGYAEDYLANIARPHAYGGWYRRAGWRGQGGRRSDIPSDGDRPDVGEPMPGYPRHEPSDAWGRYRPSWFGARSRAGGPGAWSYRGRRRDMYEATGARAPRRGPDDVRRDHWRSSGWSGRG